MYDTTGNCPVCRRPHHLCGCVKPDTRLDPLWCPDKVDCVKPGSVYPYQKPRFDCKPPYPEFPPIPYVPGDSVPKQILGLNQRIDCTQEAFKWYQCEFEKLWGMLDQAYINNGTWYAEIKQEEGYLPAGQVGYHVTTIPKLDKTCKPIKLELGLAHNNTTNSKITESCFDFGLREIADKVVPAVNVSDEGYTGYAFWKGMAIQSTGGGYTVAVTKKGDVKWYDENISPSRMAGDGVEYSMGARGLLISGTSLFPDGYPADAELRKSRAGLGYQRKSGVRIFIIVEGDETTGCTSAELADLFRGYNVDMAVELTSGASTYGCNRGNLMFTPDPDNINKDSIEPQSHAFWYVTKKEKYFNKYSEEFAEYMWKVGRNYWDVILRDVTVLYLVDEILKLWDNGGLLEELLKELEAELYAKYQELLQFINETNANLEQEIRDREAGDDELRALIQSADERITNYIDTEIANLDEKVQGYIDDLRTYVDSRDGLILQTLGEERDARISGDENLQSQLDAEIQERSDTDIALGNRITDLEEYVQEEDQKLQANIDTEKSEREAGDRELQGNIESLKTYVDDNDRAIGTKIDDLKDYVDVQDRGLSLEIETKADIFHASSQTIFGVGNLTQYGHVRLVDGTNNNSGVNAGLAATPSAVKAVNDRLTQEISDRTEGDTNLQTNINNLNTTLRQLIIQEANLREAGDDALRSRIDEWDAALATEIQNRIDNDGILRNRIANLEDNLENNYYTIQVADGRFALRLQTITDPYDNNTARAELVADWLTQTNDKNWEQDGRLMSLEEVVERLSALFNIRGSVETVADLPATGNEVNDTYLVNKDADHDNQATLYAWDGTGWVYITEFPGLNLDAYYTKSQVDAIAKALADRLAVVETRLNVLRVDNGVTRAVEFTGTLEEVVSWLYQYSVQVNGKIDVASVFGDGPDGSQLAYQGTINNCLSFLFAKQDGDYVRLLDAVAEINNTTIPAVRNSITNIGANGNVIITDLEGNNYFNGKLNEGLSKLYNELSTGIDAIDIGNYQISFTASNDETYTLPLVDWIKEFKEYEISTDSRLTPLEGDLSSLKTTVTNNGLVLNLLSQDVNNTLRPAIQGNMDSITALKNRLDQFSLNNASGDPVISGTVEEVSQWLYNYASTEFANDRDRLDALENGTLFVDVPLDWNDLFMGDPILDIKAPILITNSAVGQLNSPPTTSTSSENWGGIFVPSLNYRSTDNGLIFVANQRFNPTTAWVRAKVGNTWRDWVRLDNVDSGSGVENIFVEDFNTFNPPENFAVINTTNAIKNPPPSEFSENYSGVWINNEQTSAGTKRGSLFITGSSRTAWVRYYFSSGDWGNWARLDNVSNTITSIGNIFSQAQAYVVVDKQFGVYENKGNYTHVSFTLDIEITANTNPDAQGGIPLGATRVFPGSNTNFLFPLQAISLYNNTIKSYPCILNGGRITIISPSGDPIRNGEVFTITANYLVDN